MLVPSVFQSEIEQCENTKSGRVPDFSAVANKDVEDRSARQPESCENCSAAIAEMLSDGKLHAIPSSAHEFADEVAPGRSVGTGERELQQLASRIDFQQLVRLAKSVLRVDGAVDYASRHTSDAQT